MSPSPQVLVVEDDPGTRTLYRAVLERLGLTTTSACDGDEALELLAERRFDAIVLDLMMPGTDGATLLRELTIRTPGMLEQIVIVTALCPAQLRGIRELDDVAVVLRKPLDIYEFGAEVVACVAASAVARQVRAAATDDRLAN